MVQQVKYSSFPQESIDQAKFIAKQYNARYSTAVEKASALFQGKFLEIGYGFDEAIKNGTTGLFLHELKRNTECFSMAGMMYQVAKELSLKPKIYQAKNMRDLSYGQRAADASTSDHAFISVTINKNEWLLDPNHSIAAKIIKKEE